MIHSFRTSLSWSHCSDYAHAPLPRYFIINSSTALVIPIIPKRIVGSGTGANLLDCTLGSGTPVFAAHGRIGRFSVVCAQRFPPNGDKTFR